MHPFSYTSAHDEGGAIAAASPNASFIAGGTTLVDLMKLDVMTPALLVDINLLPLVSVQEHNGGVRIGALVKNSDLAYHPLIVSRYPVLSQALLSGASPQLRNMATTGGNVLQRTRCYYFRDTAMPCNKREPGTGCSAIGGYNRILAILGTSEHCIATNPSDMNVAMIALDAVVQVKGPGGERSIPFAEFHTLPGDHPEIETMLRPGELITAVDLPAMPWAKCSHYLKSRDRASYAFALASAAVALDVQGGVIKQARIALGGIGTKPWRSIEAEQALIGKTPGIAAYQATADAALAGATTYKDNAFKVPLAKRTLVRALTTAGEMA